jgi:hypothetical protein
MYQGRNDGVFHAHSNSILTSAHGLIENSIAFLYCLIVVIHESGPGTDTFTASGNLQTM